MTDMIQKPSLLEKPCPRCNGNLFIDWHNTRRLEANCLQCGHTEPIKQNSRGKRNGHKYF